MKRKNIIIAILPVLFGLIFLQGCKEDIPTISIFGAFSDPVAVAPMDEALIKITGTTTELKWAATDPEGDAPLSDVYFSTDENPKLFKAGHNALSLTVPVEEGSNYHWYVKMYDVNKVMTTSPIFSFSVLVNYDINKFLGEYECDEPGYKKYMVNMTKVDDNTISNDNFWDSGWAVEYVFDEHGDVNITPVSYESDGVTYDITGSGKFNNKDMGFYVDYLVVNHETGKTVDENTHTFVKQ